MIKLCRLELCPKLINNIMSYFSERIPEVGGIDYMYTLDGVVCQWNLEIKVPTLDYLVLLKK